MTEVALRWLLLATVLASAACAGFGIVPPAGPARVSDQLGEGDAARRASMRLVLRGLDDEADGQWDLGRGAYERALQVDPSNPWAYLALARHYATGSYPPKALPFLDKARALFAAQGTLTPGVEAHLQGLRGVVLNETGQAAEAEPLLDYAARHSPQAWSDGTLAPQDLR